MKTGTVKWFNPDCQYGFIIADGSKAEVFVHLSSVRDRMPLKIGQNVRFEVADWCGKLRARSVSVIEGRKS